MANYLDKDGLIYVWSKIKSLVATKVDRVDGKGLSTNDFTTEYKTKLDGISAGANKITVDTELSSTSTNPVQNKIVKSALDDKIGTTKFKTLSDRVNDLYDTKADLDTATTASNGLMSKTDKAKLDSFSSASDYAKKTDLASVYKYKGSKATKSALPTTGNTVGDVWNSEEDDMNYAWDGTKWDPLGGSFNVTSITNAEIDTITAE